MPELSCELSILFRVVHVPELNDILNEVVNVL